MRTEITSLHWPVTDALQGHIHACLAHLETRFGDRIKEIEIRLLDVNGPKGGEDKVCRIQARIDKHPSFHTEGRNGDLYQAINLAVRRMERALESVLDGTRTRNPKARCMAGTDGVPPRFGGGLRDEDPSELGLV
jgi:putative sigma-54 modulation protein